MLYSLYYSGENVNMVRLVLLEFWRKKHHQRIRKCFDDADYCLDTELCNETRFKAVGSLKLQKYLFFL